MDNVTIGVLLDIDVVFIDIDIGVLPGLWARSPVRGVHCLLYTSDAADDC